MTLGEVTRLLEVLFFPGVPFHVVFASFSERVDWKAVTLLQNQVVSHHADPSRILHPLAYFLKILAKGEIVPIAPTEVDRCLFRGKYVDLYPNHAIEATATFEPTFFDRDAMTQPFVRTIIPTSPGVERLEED